MIREFWQDRKWWSRRGLRVALFASHWQAACGGDFALLFRGCFARVSWARTRMAGFALSGVCLEAGRNRRLALRHHGQTHRGRVVCGRLALRSTFTPARLRRGSRLRWRRSVGRRPTERAVRQLPQQQARQREAQRGNRVWVMPLGTDPATRAGGSLLPARRQRIQDDRRGQRGKNGSARLPGTHKPQCTA